MAEATQKTANYTAEMVSSMIEMYSELGNEGLDQIADTLGKSCCSKLVREGVYVASEKKVAKQDGPSKKEILHRSKILALMSELRRCYESSTDSSDGWWPLEPHYRQSCPLQLERRGARVRLVRNSSGLTNTTRFKI